MSKEWASRAALPGHVVTMLNNFPSNVHPMSQFAAAITALNSESKFAKAYADGIHKSKYWEVSDPTQFLLFMLEWITLSPKNISDKYLRFEFILHMISLLTKTPWTSSPSYP